MYAITEWPGDIALSIPVKIKDEIISLLVEPFDDEAEAKQFWQEYGNTFCILLADDNDKSILATLSEQAQLQLQFALEYPEFVEELSDCYKLSLTIMNDEGAGCYLLFSPNCPLLQSIGGAENEC